MSTNSPPPSFLPDFAGRERLSWPLDASKMEIHVIEDMPSHDLSASICCHLSTVSIRDHGDFLRDKDRYNAVSYHWGSTLAADRNCDDIQ